MLASMQSFSAIGCIGANQVGIMWTCTCMLSKRIMLQSVCWVSTAPLCVAWAAPLGRRSAAGTLAGAF